MHGHYRQTITNEILMKQIKPLIAILLLLAVAIFAKGHSPKELFQEINAHYGYNQLPNFQFIEFEFHVLIPKGKDTIEVTRHWHWEIEADSAWRLDLDTSLKENSTANPEVKSQFVNDLYWLIFPQLALQDSSKTQYELMDSSDPKTKTLSITYVDNGGFSPNDTYQLKVNPQGDITEWSYFKASAKEPTLTTSWENYKEVGGIYFSTLHKGPGGFQVDLGKIRVQPKEDFTHEEPSE